MDYPFSEMWFGGICAQKNGKGIKIYQVQWNVLAVKLRNYLLNFIQSHYHHNANTFPPIVKG